MTPFALFLTFALFPFFKTYSFSEFKMAIRMAFQMVIPIVIPMAFPIASNIFHKKL
jgi:hypothetical protein